MADQIEHEHHGIDYIEIPALDLAAARAFYGAAFGWTFTEYGPNYVGINIAGREVGGIRPEAEVRAGGPLVILYSNDLEESLERVRTAGGRILLDPFAFPGGRRFHFADPSGNELAVWSVG